MSLISALSGLTAALILYCNTVAAQTLAVPESWQSSLYKDHALVGQIWSTRDERFVTPEEMLEQLSAGSVLMIGEKHDNPDHHQLELQLLQALQSLGRLRSLSLEMLDSSQTPLLDRLPQQSGLSLSALETFLQWDSAGWDWEFYGPLLALAQATNVKLFAANISNDEMRQIYQQESPSEFASPLDATELQQLYAEIDASHCQLLPESQFPAMVRVQQARDARMAESLRAAMRSGSTPQGGVNVLVAGNFHTRRDLGVSRYLLAATPAPSEAQISSLALLEVDLAELNPEAYLQQFSSIVPYDYLWFTPALTDEDYCASLQER